MEFDGEVVIETGTERVWELVSDPEVLVVCVPGAEEIERVSETTYTGTIVQSVAGISLELSGEVEMVEMDPPSHILAEATGEDNRTSSRMDATASMDIEAVEEGSRLDYHVDMSVTGRVATVGARIMKRKISSEIDTYFENIRTVSEEGVEALQS
jgi:hypothetical protein